jgi:EAL domain-containing protein (putative c-di-GMP-specific phosphodiesterase class I)
MSKQYLYLKLLLRNNLQLAPEEYTLLNTREHGLMCSFRNMELATVFQPVFQADGKLLGREALLRVSRLEHGEQTPQSAFDEAVEEKRAVQFDRLVRIIHLMNHARSSGEHELLFLKVHPHLLSSVGDHGRIFERVLHFYSVPTSHVVIEVRETEDEAVLFEALNNYRALGYRVAVDGFGEANSNLEKVLRLKPDIVKLDKALLDTAARSRNAAVSLKQLVARFHGAGIKVDLQGIETPGQLEIARHSGADLLQGDYLAPPGLTAVPCVFCRSERLAA